jgi:hypothetical protein
MTVEEAVARAAEMPDGSVLVAKPPLTWASEAMFVQLTDDYGLPQHVKDDGYEYLLGRDDLDDLLTFLRKKKASSRTRAEFVIYYGMMDASPAWIDDIPDAP